MNESIVELEARRTYFFSEYDEEAFFQWLNKLECVSEYAGMGDILYIRIRATQLDEYALRELLALFYRYEIDMTQLAVFDRTEFAEWFRGKEKYWHERVFGARK